MTPAEASEIDRLEFEAEAAAIRQRAYALTGMSPTRKPAPIQAPVPEPDLPVITVRAVPKVHMPPRTAKRYTVSDKTLTLKEWADETGLSVYTIRSRLAYGWTVEQAVTKLPQPRREDEVH